MFWIITGVRHGGHRIYLTLVHAEIPGDTYFPEWRHLPWRELESRESRDANFRYKFSILERIRS